MKRKILLILIFLVAFPSSVIACDLLKFFSFLTLTTNEEPRTTNYKKQKSSMNINNRNYSQQETNPWKKFQQQKQKVNTMSLKKIDFVTDERTTTFP